MPTRMRCRSKPASRRSSQASPFATTTRLRPEREISSNGGLSFPRYGYNPLVGAAMPASATFHHEAMFYSGEDEFVERCQTFVEDGLDQGEPVLVMVRARKLELLRGPSASAPPRSSSPHGDRRPQPGSDHPRLGPLRGRPRRGCPDGMRGIGEPIWGERGGAELDECQLHESLINLAFAEADSFKLICPYDTWALSEEVIAEARRSLRWSRTQGHRGQWRLLRDRQAARFASRCPSRGRRRAAR